MHGKQNHPSCLTCKLPTNNKTKQSKPLESSNVSNSHEMEHLLGTGELLQLVPLIKSTPLAGGLFALYTRNFSPPGSVQFHLGQDFWKTKVHEPLSLRRKHPLITGWLCNEMHFFYARIPRIGWKFHLAGLELVSFFIKRVRATTQSAVSSNLRLKKKKNQTNRIEGEWDGNGAGERKERMLQFCWPGTEIWESLRVSWTLR